MTGKEAWAIVSPLIAAMIPGMPTAQASMEIMSDAYVTTYIALQQYDKEVSKD